MEDSGLDRALPPPPPSAQMVPGRSQEMTLGVLVDESGSMRPHQVSAEQMVRDFVVRRRAADRGHLLVMAFSSDSRVIYEGPLFRAPATYQLETGGSTALLDSISDILGLLSGRALGDDANDECAVLAIVTDGMEAGSCRSSVQDVAREVADARARGMMILFLGVDESSLEFARSIGIPAECCSVHSNQAGTYAAMSRVLSEAVDGYKTRRQIGFTQEQRKLLTGGT